MQLPEKRAAIRKPKRSVSFCIALQKRHFEENVKKRKSLCLEKFGMPDEMNATGLKMSVDTEQNEKSEYVYVRR